MIFKISKVNSVSKVYKWDGWMVPMFIVLIEYMHVGHKLLFTNNLISVSTGYWQILIANTNLVDIQILV